MVRFSWIVIEFPSSTHLPAPRGTHAMQIAVEVKLEQRCRIIRRTTGVGAAGLGKSQRVEIERTDEGVEKTDGIFGGDVILQPFGKQQRLGAIQSGAMIHACHRRRPDLNVSTMSDFSHSLW